MPQTGVEPALTCVNSDLNAARLPIPPLRQPLEHIYHTKKLTKLKRKILIIEQDNLFFITYSKFPVSSTCSLTIYQDFLHHYFDPQSSH